MIGLIGVELTNQLLLFLKQELILLDPMFEIPGSNITSVEINEEVVRGSTAPKYVRTSEEEDSSNDSSSPSSQDHYDTESATRAVNN